jgi:hypothetical protein
MAKKLTPASKEKLKELGSRALLLSQSNTTRLKHVRFEGVEKECIYSDKEFRFAEDYFGEGEVEEVHSSSWTDEYRDEHRYRIHIEHESMHVAVDIVN